MARIIIAGSRTWADSAPINELVHQLDKHNDVIITGGATGVDSIAHAIALGLGFETMVFTADWKKHGRAAGPIRNKDMLTIGKPDKIFVFHNDLKNSKGTRNLALQAIGMKIPVYDMTDTKTCRTCEYFTGVSCKGWPQDEMVCWRKRK